MRRVRSRDPSPSEGSIAKRHHERPSAGSRWSAAGRKRRSVPFVTPRRPFVSVIVPVFDDCRNLLCCIDALERQSYPRELFEVIVVDNGGAELPDLSITFPQARVIREPRPGSYAARNAGIAAARGEALAFTDADCVPSPEWLEKGAMRLIAFERPGIIAGQLRRVTAHSNRPNLAELYDRMFFLNQELYVRAGHFGCTANLVAWAATFREVGQFDAELKSGGDVEWGQRAWRQGVRVHYARDVVVDHGMLSNPLAIIRKARRVVGGHYQLRSRSRYGVLERLKDAGRELLDIRRKYGEFRLRGGDHSPFVKSRMCCLIAAVQVARGLERLRIMAGGQPRRQ